MTKEERREKHLLYMKEYNKKNKEKLSEWKRQKRLNMSEQEKEEERRYRREYQKIRLDRPGKRMLKNEASKRYRIKNKSTLTLSNYLSNKEYRDMIIKAYGGKCACCGETMNSFLQIDHINNNGSQERKTIGRGIKFYKWIIRRGFPDDYQLLCANCNMSKRLLGKCEHEIYRDYSKDSQVLYKRPSCSDETCYL